MRTLFLLNQLPVRPIAPVRCRSRSMLPPRVQACAGRIYHSGHKSRRSCPGAGQCRCAAGPAERGRTAGLTAGGDGTFNEALTGIYGYANAAVGCLPFGSGNDFLRTFGTKEEFLDLDASWPVGR